MESATVTPLVPGNRRQTVQALRHELDNNCYRQPAKREAIKLALLLVEHNLSTDTAYHVLNHVRRLAGNLSRRTVIDRFFRLKFSAVSNNASLS